MARRKENNGEKSPWGQCLTRPVPNCRGRSGFWLVPENFCVFLPNQKAERWRPFGTGLVRHFPQGFFSPFFTFLRAIFSRPLRLSLALTICPWVSEDVTINKITKIVRALWLAEGRVCMRVCKHDCDVKMFCFSRANHASTNLKKVLSWTRQVYFTYPFLRRLNLEKSFETCCVNFFSLELTF